MDNCVIVCSRPVEGVPQSVTEALDSAFILAVDGGLQHLQAMGVKPAAWVGDGDSLGKKLTAAALKGVHKVKLPRAKNYSDLEFALNVAGVNYLAGVWEGDVILLGAQGGRFDHDVINMIVVQNWLREMAERIGAGRCPEVVSIGEHGVWVATMNEAKFEQPRGRVFSVFTLDPVLEVTITGAKYNIRRKQLGSGSQGLSNEGLGKLVRIKTVHPRRGAAPGPVFIVFPSGE